MENHLISRNVLPSGSESVISLVLYLLITPELPRSSRNLKAPLLLGRWEFPT